MAETIDAYAEAQSIRESFIAETNIPFDEADEEYPLPEEVPDDFPEDYARQYEIIGYDTPSGYIGVWWLGDGMRLQPYFDGDERWGDVGAIDYTEQQIRNA